MTFREVTQVCVNALNSRNKPYGPDQFPSGFLNDGDFIKTRKRNGKLREEKLSRRDRHARCLLTLLSMMVLGTVKQ